MSQPVALNTSTFASEAFAEEVIVLDTHNGAYFALTGAAPGIWEALLGGSSPTALAEAVASHTNADAGKVAQDMAGFISDLMDEGVLIARDGDAADGPAPDLSKSSKDYLGFVWDKHEELDELLTLDPIHEVDPTKGWPHVG